MPSSQEPEPEPQLAREHIGHTETAPGGRGWLPEATSENLDSQQVLCLGPPTSDGWVWGLCRRKEKFWLLPDGVHENGGHKNGEQGQI